MKTRRKLLSITNMLCFLFVISGAFPLAAFTQTGASVDTQALESPQIEEKWQSEGDGKCGSEADYSYVDIASNVDYFLPQEVISVPFAIKAQSSISTFQYTADGFEVLSAAIDSNDPWKINFALNCAAYSESYQLSLSITLVSNQVITAGLYAVNNVYGTFISPFSTDDARERYLDYAKSANILTQTEYERIKGELSRRGVLDTSYTIAPNLPVPFPINND